MKPLLILILAAALGGCVSYRSTVDNQTCDFSGWGLIGGSVAKYNYDECVMARQAKGSK